MSHTIEVVLTDAEHDAIAAKVADGDVRAYLQGQVDTIAGQFVLVEKRAAFTAVGLSPVLADAKLDAEQEAILLDDAAVKHAARAEALKSK